MLIKSILVTLCCLSIGVIYARSAAVYSGKPSDLEVGTLGPEDKLLFVVTAYNEPQPGLESLEAEIQSDYVDFKYVNVTESGNHPDARAYLVKGGPGFNHVTIRLVPGPTYGFNYTIDLYGIELPLIPEGTSRKVRRLETRKYVQFK